MSDRNNKYALLAGLVIGGAIGAAAGILFAPASGEKTRKELAKQAESLSKDLEKKATALKSDIEKKALKVKKDSLDPIAKSVESEFKRLTKKKK